MTGEAVGNYRIVAKLGEGGMGQVFKGFDTMLERDVAIKSLRPELSSDPTVVERFRTEAVALGRLNHPHIATLYSFVREGEQHFMILEFVRGEPLNKIIARRGAIPWPETIEIVSQALEGLEHAHRLGVVHRDIKPANIMITYAGDVKLMDFGIARLLERSRLTRTGHLIGTLEYMAPEQIQGRDTDCRGDIYSLGVVLYEMLTGHVPFERATEYELIRSQVEEPPPPLRARMPQIPAALEKVALKALGKKPEERYSSSEGFRTALTEVLEAHSGVGGAHARARPAPETRLMGPSGRYAGGDANVPNPDSGQTSPGLLLDEPVNTVDDAAAGRSSFRRTWKTYPGVFGLGAAVVVAGSIVALGLWQRSVHVEDPEPIGPAPNALPDVPVPWVPDAGSLEPGTVTASRRTEQPPSTASPSTVENTARDSSGIAVIAPEESFASPLQGEAATSQTERSPPAQGPTTPKGTPDIATAGGYGSPSDTPAESAAAEATPVTTEPRLVSPTEGAAAEAEQRRAARAQDLLGQVEEILERSSISDPGLGDAADLLREARELAPEHPRVVELSYLHEKLSEAGRLLQSARRKRDFGDLEGSLVLIDQALERVPDAPELADLRRQVDAALHAQRNETALILPNLPLQNATEGLGPQERGPSEDTERQEASVPAPAPKEPQIKPKTKAQPKVQAKPQAKSQPKPKPQQGPTQKREPPAQRVPEPPVAAKPTPKIAQPNPPAAPPPKKPEPTAPKSGRKQATIGSF